MSLLYRSTAVLLLFGLFISQTSAYQADTSIPPDPTARAVTPLELLSNDKEEQSILLKSEQIEHATELLGASDQILPRLQRIAAALAQDLYGDLPAGQTNRAVCEQSFLAHLDSLASQEGFPTDADGLQAVLVALRTANLVDDLLLKPLFKYLPAYTKTPSPQPGGVCAGDLYLHLFQDLRASEQSDFKRKHFRTQVLSKPNVVGANAELFNQLYDLNWDQVPYTLGKMAEIMISIKDRSLPSEKPSEATSFASGEKKKSGGLSRRMALYALYSREQIRDLSNIFYRYNYRVWAFDHSAWVGYDKDNKEVESIPLTPLEQAHAEVRELHKEIANDARVSGIYQGRSIDFDDVVMAGLETGVIEGHMANQVEKIEDFWNPKVSRFTKYLNIFKKYGSAALVLVPPPFNTLSAVAILLLETVIPDHSKDPTAADQGESLW